ncbi:MAG: response regulator transcription factor [Bacteroidales bacterium]|nr:response regulator transcription factor [Bacteroidales bacterium]
MNIFIVDDNQQFREAIKIYIKQILNHNIVGEAENGLDFLQHYQYSNDIVLMDLNMPELDGYHAVQKAINGDLRIKAIAVTMFKDNAYLLKLIAMGFKGCVFKSEIFKKLPAAIHEVSKGNLYFPEDINLE